MQLESAGQTDVGIRRRGRPNEDAFHISIEAAGQGALLLVADGMGGAAAGDLASSAAIAMLREPKFGEDPGRDLVEAFSEANQAVREVALSDAKHAGAGTTLVGAFLEGSSLWVANVGDSRAYRVRDGHFEQLTIDHSYVQEEMGAGRITPAEARVPPRRNIITRNLGSQERVGVDLTQWDVREGDTLLLCSDGLWGAIEDDELEDILQDRERSPEPTSALLVQAANEAGGADNITAVVAHVGSIDEAAESAAPAAVSSARGCRRAAAAAVLAAALLVALPLAVVLPFRQSRDGSKGRRIRG